MGCLRQIKNVTKSVLRKLPGFSLLFKRMDTYQQTIIDITNAIQTTNIEWQAAIASMRSSYDEQLNEMRQQLGEMRQQLGEMSRQISVFNQMMDNQSHELDQAKKQLQLHSKWNIVGKFALKKAYGVPIKVVFLIEEPSVIKNVISIIEELNGDVRFEVVLVNLWYKVYQDNSYTYKRPDIESVLDTSKYKMLEAYDVAGDKWLALEKLLPDYVFFSRPYDYYRNELYHIATVSKYARACYVPYGIQTIGGEVEQMVLTPECQNLYYFFMDNAIRRDTIEQAMKGTRFEEEGQLVYLGYPGMDMLRSHGEIKNINDAYFSILWLPRWHSNENNCHFFEYKDVLVNYAKNHDGCRITLRPHSLCFSHFLNSGEMTEAELAKLRMDYGEPNRIDETGNYIEAFSESTVLVADETSLIAEYFLTGKPIIFCKKETHFSLLMEKLIEGCYVVNSEEELICALEQLRDGNDFLRTKREGIVKQVLLDYGLSAACNIKEELWRDFNSDSKLL